MCEGLSLEVLRKRLEARGHRVTESSGEIGTGLTLWPDADTIITMAVEPDGTLYPEYRQRFFLCTIEPEHIFHVMGCPKPLRRQWQELASRQPPGYWRNFLSGPGSWLLCRLARFRKIVVWGERGLPWDGLDDPIHRGWGMDVPSAAAPFFAAMLGQETCRPRLVSVVDEQFPDVVAACLLFASVGMRDCNLADANAAEVYLAHHHDKIIISIPEAKVRENLLSQLTDASWVFTDASGYESSMDDGNDADSEDDSQDDLQPTDK